MTRVTDLGRKRTHHEAKFNTMFDNESKDASPLDEEQPKKKRRKHGTEETSKANERNEFNTENPQKKGWGRSEEIKANAAASETRRRRRIEERMADTICFACRERGHAARDCPSNKTGGSQSKPAMGICYRCGSSNHTLSKCRRPTNHANPLPFASCFVCKGKGHLASTCSQNKKGVYPNGGSCKLCSKTDHLARDCPLRSKAAQPAEGILFNAGIGAEALGADEDDFMAFKRKSNQVATEESARQKFKSASSKPVAATPKKKVVVF